MRNKNLWILLLLALLSAGCASWRFDGQVDNCDTSNRELVVEKKYTIASLNMKIANNEYYSLAFGKMPIGRLDLCHRRPDVFSLIAKPESAKVTISVFDEKEEYSKTWTILVPYAASLCVLPAYLDCEDIYDVKIELESPGEKRVARFKMRIDTASKFTGYSPIGLIAYQQRDNRVSHRSGKEVGLTAILDDQAKRDRRDVFVETLAHGVVAALKRLESMK
jgi:hypothetical protein